MTPAPETEPDRNAGPLSGSDPDPAGDPEAEARRRDLTASPLQPLPGAVWLVLALLGGVEAVLWAAGQGWIGGPGGVGWRLAALERTAFAAAHQAWMLETGQAPARLMLRYLAYGWVQAGPLPALLALAMVAALGKAVVEGQGRKVFLAVVLLVPPLAAAGFGLLAPAGDRAWLAGAMPLCFGLVGAWTRARWAAAGDAAGRRRAFGLIVVLGLGRLGLGLMVEAGPAWIADLAGFALGFGLAAALAPGAGRRLAARLRAR